MEGCPEPLEKIFQKIEKESEKRAEKQLNADDDAIDKPAVATLKRIKDRRRGSVSISRIGQVPEEETSSQIPLTPTAMTIASKSSFYQAQLANTSTTSVASGASAFSDDLAHTEDDSHVTQMHHIAAKPSMLPRRLSRSQSTSIIPPNHVDSTVRIGVSVQQATVKTTRGPEDGNEGPVNRSRQGSVHAAGTGAIRHRSSSSTIPNANPPSVTTSWLSKAKEFTLKFRRKNRHSISGQHLYS